jgi:glyoxylase-like metal-dependent hydrolase (beta-lactamase superfamily II)
VEQYVRAAEAEHMRITHVTETHIHADFVSGARELARRTARALLLSDEGGADWKYGYAAADGARPLVDGDAFMGGSVELRAMHTPGHTRAPVVLVTDTPAAAGPVAVLTGDFVFVGDVGRPDLLERAAGQRARWTRGRARCTESLRALPRAARTTCSCGRPWRGSACGKALGAAPSSTVGYEKLAQLGARAHDEDEFVAQVLGRPARAAAYFAHMKRLNKEARGCSAAYRARRARRGGDGRRAARRDRARRAAGGGVRGGARDRHDQTCRSTRAHTWAARCAYDRRSTCCIARGARGRGTCATWRWSGSTPRPAGSTRARWASGPVHAERRGGRCRRWRRRACASWASTWRTARWRAGSSP